MQLGRFPDKRGDDRSEHVAGLVDMWTAHAFIGWDAPCVDGYSVVAAVDFKPRGHRRHGNQRRGVGGLK
jgi:hypothetical protein